MVNCTLAQDTKGDVMNTFDDMSFTCPTCEIRQEATPDNITIHLHTKQPMYDVVEFRCKCGEAFCLFGMQDVINSTNLDNWRVERQEYADLATMQGFARVYFHDVLTDTEEGAVGYFHHILDDISGPDDIDWRE